MENLEHETKDISVTRIAGLFVLCLMLAGLAIFTASASAHSGYLIGAFAVAAVGLIAGTVFSVRSVIRALQ